MITRYILSALLIGTSLTACNQTNSSDDQTDSVATAVPVQIKDEKTDQVFEDYLVLKDNLVASDAEAARKSSEGLAESLDQIRGCENTAGLAREIAASSDLIVQREKFTALSSDIIALMKHADLNSGNMYVQYCPMANDNDGGYWLASDKSIRNPYYGSEMLNCGEVKETFSPKENL